MFDTRAIRRRRIIKGWSQKTLAKKAKLSQGTVCDIEAGKNNSPESVKRVADALGFQMEEIFVEDVANA